MSEAFPRFNALGFPVFFLAVPWFALGFPSCSFVFLFACPCLSASLFLGVSCAVPCASLRCTVLPSFFMASIVSYMDNPWIERGLDKNVQDRRIKIPKIILHPFLDVGAGLRDFGAGF